MIADGVLLCGLCGSDHLHHSYVVVFHRDGGEDARRILETHVERRWTPGIASTRHVITPADLSDNPSLRRDGIAIGFHCEMCNAHGELTIAQHKGQSLIKWRAPMTAYLSRGEDDYVA